jgi:hypothetical protein
MNKMIGLKIGEFGIEEWECLLCHKLLDDMLKLKNHLINEHKINREKLYFFWWCVIQKEEEGDD